MNNYHTPEPRPSSDSDQENQSLSSGGTNVAKSNEGRKLSAELLLRKCHARLEDALEVLETSVHELPSQSTSERCETMRTLADTVLPMMSYVLKEEIPEAIEILAPSPWGLNIHLAREAELNAKLLASSSDEDTASGENGSLSPEFESFGQK